MWFDQLTGFTETPANVRRLLQLRDGTLCKRLDPQRHRTRPALVSTL